MKFFICAMAIILGAVTQAQALLPPLYQTAEEIRGILESPQLGQSLQDGEPIVSIQKTKGGYRIITNRHQIDVTVNTLPQRMPGPARFDYQFGQAQDLQ